MRNLAAAQASFSGLHVSTLRSQAPPAFLDTQRIQSSASPEKRKETRMNFLYLFFFWSILLCFINEIHFCLAHKSVQHSNMLSLNYDSVCAPVQELKAHFLVAQQLWWSLFSGESVTDSPAVNSRVMLRAKTNSFIVLFVCAACGS